MLLLNEIVVTCANSYDILFRLIGQHPLWINGTLERMELGKH